MISFIFAAFVAFPKCENAIFSSTKKENIMIENSGSLGLFHYENNICVGTNGNETISDKRKEEWCSTILTGNEYPFIQYSIQGKKMKISKYSVRNGCCDYYCCCTETGKEIERKCCCELYSYSLLGSNDNRTWTKLHSVSKDKKFYHCLTKTFEFEKQTQPFKYIRFLLDEEYPNCERCLQLNQVELYGEIIEDIPDFDNIADEDEDESISIIGRVKKNE